MTVRLVTNVILNGERYIKAILHECSIHYTIIFVKEAGINFFECFIKEGGYICFNRFYMERNSSNTFCTKKNIKFFKLRYKQVPYFQHFLEVFSIYF